MAANDMMQAKEVFDTLCSGLDNRGWKYEKNEEEMEIDCVSQGDDLPIPISMHVNQKGKLVVLLSLLPFEVNEDIRIDMAVAISVINNILINGSFDYNISEGRIFFRMTNSFIDSKIGEDVFFYMVMCASQTIDDYNDKLLLLANGKITIQQLLDSITD